MLLVAMTTAEARHIDKRELYIHIKDELCVSTDKSSKCPLFSELHEYKHLRTRLERIVFLLSIENNIYDKSLTLQISVLE